MIGPTSEFSITNEIGINDVNVTVLPTILIRLHQLFEYGSKDIDQRWFSGDWGSEADIDNIDRYIYNPSSGNGLLSSISPRNVNITARFSSVEIMVPSAKENDDEHNCLLFTIPDFTFLLSSSLPRMFLSEEIPNTDNCSLDATLLFPKESINYVYQTGTSLSQVVRFQLTLNGVSVKVSSPVFSYDTSRVQNLLNLSKLVILGSLEKSEQPIRGAMKHMFLSVFCQEINIYVDVDLFPTALIIFLSYRSYLEFLRVSQYNPLSLCNLTTRLSTTDITVSLLTAYHGAYGEDEGPNHYPDTLPLNLRFDGIDISVQIYLSDSEASLCLLCKGQVAKTIIYSSCTPCERLRVADTKLQGVSFRLEVDGSGVLKGGATISDGEVYFSRSTFDTFASLMTYFEQEERASYLKNLIEPKHGADPEFKFIIATIQINKVHIYMQDTIIPKNLSVVLDELSFQIGYRANKEVSETYTCIWNEFYRDHIPGFHYKVLSRIKCFSHEKNITATELGIVSFDGYLHPSNFRWEIQDCRISFDELSLLKDWKGLLHETQGKIQVLFRTIAETFNSQNKRFQHGLSITEDDREHSPLLQLFDSFISDLSHVKYRLRKAKSKMNDTLLEKNRAALDFKREIERLHRLLLSSELRRLVAFSSISHEMSGFLRVNSTTISGQRFVSATSFWNYFVVLRKSHLFILKDTTHVSALIRPIIVFASRATSNCKICCIPLGKSPRNHSS
jgi:hypothetical protein